MTTLLANSVCLVEMDLDRATAGYDRLKGIGRSLCLLLLTDVEVDWNLPNRLSYTQGCSTWLLLMSSKVGNQYITYSSALT